MDKIVYLKGGEANPYAHLPQACVAKESIIEGTKYTVIKKVKEYSLIQRVALFFFYTIATALSLGMLLISSHVRDSFSKVFSGKKIIELRIAPEEKSKKSQRNLVEHLKPNNVDAAAQILKAGNFKQDTEGSSRKGYKVSEAQGSDKLRRNARLMTLKNPDILSPETLKEAKDADIINYLTIKLKRIGHAFSLEKDVVHAHDKFGYEGFSEDFTIPMLTSALYKAEKELKGDGKFRFAGDVLNRSLSNEWAPASELDASLKIIHDVKSNEVVSVSSGYDWHGTHIFFFKGFLIYVNKGNFSNGGITVYRMREPTKVTLKLLNDLTQRQKFSSNDFLSEYKLQTELDLERVTQVRLKDQGVGNCTYVSTRSASRVLMAIFDILKGFKEKGETLITASTWNTAFNKTKDDYKKFFYFDRSLLLDDLMDDVTKGDTDFEFFSKKELFTDILKKIRPFKAHNYKPEHLTMLRA